MCCGVKGILVIEESTAVYHRPGVAPRKVEQRQKKFAVGFRFSPRFPVNASGYGGGGHVSACG